MEELGIDLDINFEENKDNMKEIPEEKIIDVNFAI